jgi:hypothetical protein
VFGRSKQAGTAFFRKEKNDEKNIQNLENLHRLPVFIPPDGVLFSIYSIFCVSSGTACW